MYVYQELTSWAKPCLTFLMQIFWLQKPNYKEKLTGFALVQVSYFNMRMNCHAQLLISDLALCLWISSKV